MRRFSFKTSVRRQREYSYAVSQVKRIQSRGRDQTFCSCQNKMACSLQRSLWGGTIEEERHGCICSPKMVTFGTQIFDNSIEYLTDKEAFSSFMTEIRGVSQLFVVRTYFYS